MARKIVRYDPAHDLYSVLGIRPSATKEEIQRAFRQRAKDVHPDRNLDRLEWANHEFSRINEAHDLLTDDSRRVYYDRQRRKFHPNDRYVTRGDWWNEPHPFTNASPQATPSASGVRPPPSRTTFRRPPNPYLAALRNITFGPYRWTLLVLLFALLINIAFFMTAASVQRERALGISLTATSASAEHNPSLTPTPNCGSASSVSDDTASALQKCDTLTPTDAH